MLTFCTLFVFFGPCWLFLKYFEHFFSGFFLPSKSSSFSFSHSDSSNGNGHLYVGRLSLLEKIPKVALAFPKGFVEKVNSPLGTIAISGTSVSEMSRGCKVIVVSSRKWKASSQCPIKPEASRLILAKRKRNDRFLPISNPKYSWVLDYVTSYASEFTSRDKVKEFVATFNICPEVMAEFIGAKPCSKADYVFIKSSRNSDDFTLVYKYFFKEFDILFPLSHFECQILTVMVNLKGV